MPPKKLDNLSKGKWFKQPKGLAVCESQAASPSVLHGYDLQIFNSRTIKIPRFGEMAKRGF